MFFLVLTNCLSCYSVWSWCSRFFPFLSCITGCSCNRPVSLLPVTCLHCSALSFTSTGNMCMCVCMGNTVRICFWLSGYTFWICSPILNWSQSALGYVSKLLRVKLLVFDLSGLVKLPKTTTMFYHWPPGSSTRGTETGLNGWTRGIHGFKTDLKHTTREATWTLCALINFQKREGIQKWSEDIQSNINRPDK